MIDAPIEVIAPQEPRFIHIPDDAVDNAGQEAINLVAEAGQPMDGWQQVALRTMLGETAQGTWAAQEMGICVARQQGKNAVLEARELAGLFLFGETRIVHSAHQAATADEAFKRMRNLIEGVPWLDQEVAKILGSPGRQSIKLKNGSELSYRTRTAGGARGFSAPIVVFDEAQELSGAQLAAIIPVTSSFRNRQVIYTGTVLAGASVFRGVVERGRKGIGAALGYAEWSAPEDCESDDPVAIRQANPGIGNRPGLTVQYCLNELEMFKAAGEEGRWREERLSIWPDQNLVGSVIPLDAWDRALSEWRPPFMVQGGAVGVAVSMDRTYAVVAYAVLSPAGVFVEAVAQTGDTDPVTGVVREGIDWVIPWVSELYARRFPECVVVDKAGPAFPLVNGMVGAGLPVRVASFEDWKAACAQFVDEVVAGRVEHSGQPQVQESAAGVRKRMVGDAWVYDRKTPGVRVAPLEAVTLAAWGVIGTLSPPSKYEQSDLLVLG